MSHLFKLSDATMDLLGCIDIDLPEAFNTKSMPDFRFGLLQLISLLIFPSMTVGLVGHKCDGRNSETLRPISHKPVQQQ